MKRYWYSVLSQNPQKFYLNIDQTFLDWRGDTGAACNTDTVTVTSNGTWTVTNDTQWTPNILGATGDSEVVFTYTPESPPESVSIYFNIGSVTYATLTMQGYTGPCE